MVLLYLLILRIEKLQGLINQIVGVIDLMLFHFLNQFYPKSLKFVFFVSSVTSVISISMSGSGFLKKFFRKCSRSPILTPVVSNRSSFKSRLTNSKSQRPQGPSTGPNLENFQGFDTTYSVTYSKG